ncbi:bifunctional non-homologous end joining protein LigD [Cohnella sp. OV330]|uniref:non-homologous end-joining DNA ligase n=1 Tax=Cohnella sp. OV330 TaxID=1855288 RepID=UPI0008EBA8BA|nr:non-homologous end-joining DNA ligase [Cohnella sp. OV330]SFB50636.1 bifunctional non-homologous end joining protein LigD [Cohnella sp. OV330]
MEKQLYAIEGREIEITHPDRVVWPEAGIAKLDLIRYLMAVAPYMLPYTRDRMLMVWRYPDGIGGKRVEERSIHGEAPVWVPRVAYGGKERILLNDAATLAWLANRGAIEFHVPFDRYDRKDVPTELVFDLDPAAGMPFEAVREVALKLKETLDGLSLASFPKTSGATGMQIFVPIEPKYTFEEARLINAFVARYMLEQMPDRITLERVVEKRGNKLYFDYLQLWRGRTMAAVYSVRATSQATVSMPVTWEEVAAGFEPADFTIATVPQRLRTVGDLFGGVSSEAHRVDQRVDEVLAFVRRNGQ